MEMQSNFTATVLLTIADVDILEAALWFYIKEGKMKEPDVKELHTYIRRLKTGEVYE